MKRRDTLALTLAPALAAPGRAQTARLPLVGVMMPGTPELAASSRALARFHEGLRDAGWEAGRRIEIHSRHDGFSNDVLPAQVAELLRLGIDVLVAGHTGSAQVARRATTTVPIVMAVSADPVADGLVQSMSRPGGNVTGMSLASPDLTPRRLKLLVELVPNLRRVALLVDDNVKIWTRVLEEHEAAARTMSLQLLPVPVKSAADFEAAFRAARTGGAQAMVMMQSSTFALHLKPLADLALSNRLPTVSGSGDQRYARAGGLMNYGADIATSWYRAASFVGRILGGAKPAEMPIERPERFELSINLRTAEALGLHVPPHLLLLADDVVR